VIRIEPRILNYRFPNGLSGPVETSATSGADQCGWFRLPDVTTLARMANEFFRAQPGRVSYHRRASRARCSGPDAALRDPAARVRHAVAFDTAVPTAGTIPIAPDVTGLSTATPELSPFTMGRLLPCPFPLLRPSRKRECCSMIREARPPGFPSHPSRCRCLSLELRFSPLKQGFRRFRLFRRYAPETTQDPC